MSRILRRPMFRGGGPVNSYGTGITAPLVPGYEGGGQIGGGTIYGIPHADGRYGFKLPRFNTSGITGVNTTSGKDLLYASGAIAPQPVNIPGVVKEDEGELTNAEILANKKAFAEKIGTNTWDEYITVERPDRMGGTNTVTIKNKDYKPPTKTVTLPGKGRFKDRTVTLPETDEDIRRRTTTTLPGTETIYADDLTEKVTLPENNELTIEKETEESLILDPQTLMKDNQALFEEMLGLKKARGQDISDMLLRFSGSQGNTLGEKFQNYTAVEAAAGPGRAEQIGKTAAGLSIQDYIAGKRAKEAVELMKSRTDYEAEVKESLIRPQKSDTLYEARVKIAGKDGKINSNNTIAGIIAKATGSNQVVASQAKSVKDAKKNLEKLSPGYNIISEPGKAKIIVLYDGKGDPNTLQVFTLEEIWKQFQQQK